MNIIEAIKSGRPFRQRGDGSWCIRSGKLFRVLSDLGDAGMTMEFSPDEIIADDWEVQEAKVEITASQYWAAYAEAMKEAGNAHITFNSPIRGEGVGLILAQLLGLAP